MTESKQPPASVTLRVFDRQLTVRFEMPGAPVRPRELLPLFRAVADAVVGIAVEEVQKQGRCVSCKAGCGACCRQLVPITTTEARRLQAVVSQMPAPRREVILDRFAIAHDRLEESGLLERLRRPREGESMRELGLDYFREGVPCPFLENESCSIYEERPIACREYLVTSPAENCRKPTADSIKPVPLPGRVSEAIAIIGEENDLFRRTHRTPVLPLIMALEWAANHSIEPPAEAPEEVLTAFFKWLASRQSDESGSNPESAGHSSAKE